MPIFSKPTAKQEWDKTWASPGRTFPKHLISNDYRGTIQYGPLLDDSGCSKQRLSGKPVKGFDQLSLFDHGGFQPFTYASNLTNEVASLTNRAQKRTPTPVQSEVKMFIRWVKACFRELFPGFRWHWPATNEAYLRNSNASPSVKAAIQRAMTKLAERGVTHSSVLSRSELYKWTTRKAFVKMENNCYKTPWGVVDKPPRCIQGAQPEFIALVGPTMMTIQAELKRIWGKQFSLMFTSGVSAVDCASHVDIPGWVVFENDVSSWDASICEDLCRLEVWLAKQFGAGRAVLDLMSANINTHGFTTHGARYKIKGTRKSGDPYTSLMNSILNTLMHIWAFVRKACPDKTERQKSFGFADVSDLLRKVRVIVQGDDILVVFHPSLKPDFHVLWLLGFKADNIYRKHIMHAEFCSCYVYRLADGRACFGPKLGRVLGKFLCFVCPPVHEYPLAMARGVALGFANAACYVPGLQFVVDRILALTDGSEVVKPRFEEYRMLFPEAKGDVGCNNYWSDLRYGRVHAPDGYFAKFWRKVKFGDCLDVQCHEWPFCRETAGPQSVVFTGLNGNPLV